MPTSRASLPTTSPPRVPPTPSATPPNARSPGVAAAEGALTGAVATAQDLPIADYDKQTAHDIAARLKGFSQRELRMIGAYEAKHENRWTITDRIPKLTGDEPWPGYDEQNVDAITTALADGDADTAHKVRSYERDHKDRAGVVDAADRHTSNQPGSGG